MFIKTATLIMVAMVVSPAGPQEFGTARQNAEENGTPLVVVVGADWCPACVQMKTNTLPEVERSGVLANTEYTYVDYDSNPDLARKLMRGTSIPQLMRFQYKEQDEQWTVRRYQGSPRSVQQVSGFIAGN
ncbi:MAG: thioredoxin family protein [Pirellulaceae bacterium]